MEDEQREVAQNCLSPVEKPSTPQKADTSMVQCTPNNANKRKVKKKHKGTKSYLSRRDSSENFDNLHVTSPRSCVELYSQESCDEEEFEERLAKSISSAKERPPSNKLQQEMGQHSLNLNESSNCIKETTEVLVSQTPEPPDTPKPKTPVTAWTEEDKLLAHEKKDLSLPMLIPKPPSEVPKETSVNAISSLINGDTDKAKPDQKVDTKLDDIKELPKLPEVNKETKPRTELSLAELLSKHIMPGVKTDNQKAGQDAGQAEGKKKKKKEKKRESRDKEKGGSKRERGKSTGSKSRSKSSDKDRASSSHEPMPTVLRRFTRAPLPQPLTLTFDYPNTYLTHRYVFDQIKLAIQNVPFGNVNALQFCDRNVVHETTGLDNRWLITLSCPEARDYLLRNGLKLFNNKIYLKRMDDILKQEYRQFVKQEKELRRLRGETDDTDKDSDDSDDSSSDSETSDSD